MGKVALILLLLVSGCVHRGEPVSNPRRVWCSHNEPRRDAKPDSPRKEIDQINTHNRRGALWCGWKP